MRLADIGGRLVRSAITLLGLLATLSIATPAFSTEELDPVEDARGEAALTEASALGRLRARPALTHARELAFGAFSCVGCDSATAPRVSHVRRGPSWMIPRRVTPGGDDPDEHEAA